MILAISVLFQNRLILPSLWKSPYSEKTKFSTTIGQKKMDSPLILPSKSLYFGQKIFFQNFWKNWPKLWLFWLNKPPPSYEKVQILKKTKFFRTMGPKKMNSPLNLPSKSLCFGQKIFFQNFWKNWPKLWLFLVK